MLSEEQGDFGAAAGYFREAVRIDPQYGEAQGRLDGALGAEAIGDAGPGDFAEAIARVDPNMDAASEGASSANALASSTFDIASQQLERVTSGVGTLNVSPKVLPEEAQVVPSLEAILTIFIRIR
jgi:hypothetical protein